MRLNPFRSARLAVDLYSLADGPRVGRPLSPGLSSPWSVPPALEPILAEDIFGLSTLAVSRAEAMSVPALARARNLLCVLIARQPLRAYVGADVAASQPGWINRADTAQTSFHRMVWTVDDLFFYGRSLWLTEAGAGGFPLLADHVDWDDWTEDEHGRIEIDGAPIDPARCVVLDSFSEGVLSYGRRSIRMASGLDRAALSSARNPFRLEIHDISQDTLTDDEIDALVGRTRKALAENDGVLYSNQVVELKVHPFTSDNLLTEGRNYSAIDMARIGNVPAAAVDAVLSGSGITYQTGPSLNRTLIDFGAGGFLSAISARLSQNDVCPNGQRIAFDLEQFLDATTGADDPTAPPATAPAPTPTAPPAPVPTGS